MHSELRDKGLEILGFPCNQFGSQEPGTPQEINDFARGKYGAEFPIFAKCEVNGAGCHPVYNYLRTNSSLWNAEKGLANEIPWNFAKFLVGADGKVVGYYEPKTFPEDIRKDIDKLLM